LEPSSEIIPARVAAKGLFQIGRGLVRLPPNQVMLRKPDQEIDPGSFQAPLDLPCQL
jgi:hypothetical protein